MSASIVCIWQRVHDAHPALRRALRGGNVMRVRKIVGGKLAFDPEQRAIRSVFLLSETSGEIKTGRTYLFFLL